MFRDRGAKGRGVALIMAAIKRFKLTDPILQTVGCCPKAEEVRLP